MRRIIESGEIPNMIFYGPSGVGKTTLATIIAQQTKRRLCKLNGTTASTADIRAVVAQLDTLEAPNGVCCIWMKSSTLTKKQQQTLLEFIENGSITLIASTTENPYFYVYNAILSRSTVFEFKTVAKRRCSCSGRTCFPDYAGGTWRSDYPGRWGCRIYCHGLWRRCTQSDECGRTLCAFRWSGSGRGCGFMEIARQLTQRSAMRYDKGGDEHYDILSAFQKSMRGSDPDAALHYLARLIEAGDLLVDLPQAYGVCLWRCRAGVAADYSNCKGQCGCRYAGWFSRGAHSACRCSRAGMHGAKVQFRLSCHRPGACRYQKRKYWWYSKAAAE